MKFIVNTDELNYTQKLIWESEVTTGKYVELSTEAYLALIQTYLDNMDNDDELMFIEHVAKLFNLSDEKELEAASGVIYYIVSTLFITVSDLTVGNSTKVLITCKALEGYISVEFSLKDIVLSLPD